MQYIHYFYAGMFIASYFSSTLTAVFLEIQCICVLYMVWKFWISSSEIHITTVLHCADFCQCSCKIFLEIAVYRTLTSLRSRCLGCALDCAVLTARALAFAIELGFITCVATPFPNWPSSLALPAVRISCNCTNFLQPWEFLLFAGSLSRTITSWTAQGYFCLEQQSLCTFTLWTTKLHTASTIFDLDVTASIALGTFDAVPIQHTGNAPTNIAFAAHRWISSVHCWCVAHVVSPSSTIRVWTLYYLRALLWQ